MSALNILAELPHLSSGERTQLAQALQRLTAVESAATPPPSPRIAGLHAGAWDIPDDFDDPLPDEFWLGEDA